MEINLNMLNNMGVQVEFMKNCEEHPGCIGCKYYNTTGYEDIICNTAVEKIERENANV